MRHKNTEGHTSLGLRHSFKSMPLLHIMELVDTLRFITSHLLKPISGLDAACAAGDGRHVLSNAKDQTAKLWDLRKMLSASQHARMPPARIPNFEWDYRRVPSQYPSTPATFLFFATLSAAEGCRGFLPQSSQHAVLDR